MTNKDARNLFLLGVILATILITGAIFGDSFKGRRNWIDLCVIEQWETTGEHRIGVRDFCLAKFRQTR